MHFDPNTGEKIMDPGDEVQAAAGAVNQAADQAAQAAANQTAAAQAAAQAQAAQAAAQAQTAQAQAQAVANQAAAAQAAAQAQAAQAQAQFQAQPGFQQAPPQFQQAPAMPQTKEKKGLPIGAVIGIIAVIAVVIAGVIFFIKGRSSKISLLDIFTESFDGSYIDVYTKDVQIGLFDDFTYTCNGELEDIEFSVSFANAPSSHQRSVYAELTYSGFTMDATAYVDDKKFVASAPIVGDYLFTYDYSNDKNDGYLIEMLDEYDIDAETFNLLIAFLNDNNSALEKLYNQSDDYITGCINGLDFKKTGEKETFTVNGQKVECKEYQVVVNQETVEGWITGYQEIWNKFYKENKSVFEPLEDLTGEEFDFADYFDEAVDSLDDMEDLTISVFVKGKDVACVRFASEEEENAIDILFKGGDYRAQNVEVIVTEDGDEETVLVIEGKTKGDVQTSTITVGDDEMILEWSFDRKSGELAMTMEQDGYEMYNLECTITVAKNSITMTYDTLEVSGSEMPFDSFEVIFSTKADIVEPKKGEEFDLGNADEDEFYDLVEEIQETIMDNDDLMELMEDAEDLYYYF